MKLPKKISPCPIVEAIIEIRFDASLPGDAIFGIIYNMLKDEYTNLEKLPILELPDAIRTTDPNLMYSPHYKLRKDNFIIQIGPKVFSLVNFNEYCGWDLFYNKTDEVFTKIAALKIINKIKRMGLRYINIFPALNMYEKSNLKINIDNESFITGINLVLNIPAPPYINTLRMVSSTEAIVADKVLTGSVIDIDTVLDNVPDNFFENMNTIINKAHVEEKALFFNLLKPDYITTLNPEY